MVPLFLLALVLARGLPARSCTGACSTGAKSAWPGLLQATSLPFLVATTAIGRELGLIGAGEGAALVGAGLLSVLLFLAAGLALLRRGVTNRPAPGLNPDHRPKGTAMHTSCSAYTTDAEAFAAVERLLADGTPGARISVLTGRMTADHRGDRVGAFAGAAGAVGMFAGPSGATADAMGSFAASAADQRRGSFGEPVGSDGRPSTEASGAGPRRSRRRSCWRGCGPGTRWRSTCSSPATTAPCSRWPRRT